METCLSIELTKLTESQTNPRGREGFTGSQFEDFMASIKEKGVLMPILVRPDKDIPDRYEVIAGARRFRAAQKLGMKEIPARLVKMTDIEVREAQIIENLQRSDIHPIEEGIAYRNLIEKSKPIYTIKDVAAKVGKSEVYVRQRLGLTNLTPKCVKAFRDGQISPSYAVELARLDNTKAQEELMRRVVDGYIDSVAELKEEIRDRVYTDLGNKPWAKDAKLSEILGEKSEETLFGKTTNDDPVEYARKMSAYIEIKMREAEEKGKPMVKISTSYGKPDIKDALPRDAYRMLSDKKAVKEAKSPIKGIEVEGDNLGKIHWITTDPADMKKSGDSGLYKRTAKEIARERAAKKKAAAEEEKKTEKELSENDTTAQVFMAMSDKDAIATVMLDLALVNASEDTQRKIVESKGWELQRQKIWSGGDTTRPCYEKTLRVEGAKMPAVDRIHLAYQIFFMDAYRWDKDNRKRLLAPIVIKLKPAKSTVDK